MKHGQIDGWDKIEQFFRYVRCEPENREFTAEIMPETFICVVRGYPISNAIVHVPVAGHEMTSFLAQLLQEREPSVPRRTAL
jgi:actin-related protein